MSGNEPSITQWPVKSSAFNVLIASFDLFLVNGGESMEQRGNCKAGLDCHAKH